MTKANNNKNGNGNGKNGRPKIDIDFKQLEGFCLIQCSLSEIATFFNCSEDTIERRVKEHFGVTFADYFAKKRIGGLISLRRNLFKLSEKNAAVAIFLAKNWLGMADKTEVANAPGESFRIEHDAKGKLISALDRLAAQADETESDQSPETTGS